MASGSPTSLGQDLFYPKQKNGGGLDNEESKLLRGVADLTQNKGVTGSPQV